MVAKFSQLLTCQIVTGTKHFRKNPHFFMCSIPLLADIDLRECRLVFHAQVKYIEAIRLNGKTSSDIIRCLNEILSRHGYPQTLIADNMPYNSREMRKYATQYGINIITTSPTYSQADGLAEKAVYIVKNLLRKECNLNEGLMEYRNTPIAIFLIRLTKCYSVGKSEQEFLFTPQF